MVSFEKTKRTFDWRGRVTWPCLVAVCLFFPAILVFHWINNHFDTGVSACLFRNVTDYPCTLCGGTRASLSLARGDFWTALQFNPLVTISLIVIAGLVVLKVGFGEKIVLRNTSRRAMWIAAILLGTLNWIYVVWHFGKMR